MIYLLILVDLRGSGDTSKFGEILAEVLFVGDRGNEAEENWSSDMEVKPVPV